jgi:hypothetical protein
MSSTPIIAPEPSSAGLSQMERVTNTFFEPSKTMADIRRSTSWWVPWLILSIFSYGLVFAWQQKIGFEKLAETQLQIRLAASPSAADRWEKTQPDQQEKQRQVGLVITKVIAYAIPVFTLVVLLIVAALLMAIFNFGFGTKATFQQVLAITAYSWLPGIISSVLAVVTVFLSDPDGYDMRQPVASGLNAFVNSTQHPSLWALLSAFDIFTFWYIFLLATGFSVISNNKLKRGTAFAAIFAALFIWKLIGAGMAAMM